MRQYVEKESMKPIVIRTIQRAVKYLMENEGLLEYKSGKYCLSEKAKTEAGYFPDLFGQTLLSSLCSFRLGSQEENIREIVQRFGAMIIYVFIQALSSDKYTSSSTNIRPQVSWVEETIPMREMFEYFLSMIMGMKKSNYRFKSIELSLNKDAIERIMQSFKNLYPEIYTLLDKSKQSIQTSE